MRSVNVAELKDQLSKYLTFAKGGEEVVIRDRNLPVAKLVPFSAEGADEEELKLVAAGKLRLPKVRLDVKQLRRNRLVPAHRIASPVRPLARTPPGHRLTPAQRDKTVFGYFCSSSFSLLAVFSFLGSSSRDLR